jgi:hypothetical protein
MKRFLVFAYLVVLCLSGMGQKKAEEALQKFNQFYPLEKVFIQYNKESYVAGEKMWFKCYVFSEYAFSNQATNLYVELYNQQKQLLDKSIIPLLDGSGEGNFTIGQQLDEGVYYIRAYTKWMLNYDENFPYLHRFLVFNPQSTSQLKAKPIRWEAKAFAESGHLVAGTINKVAFRLFSGTAMPSSWKGIIHERNNPSKEIVAFSSLNEEVSAVEMIPEAGKTYVATINDNAGNVQTIPLPAVQSSGVVLKVQQQADTMVCTAVFKNLPKANHYKLVGHMQHHLVCQAKIINHDSVVTVKLPASLLTDGIIHFTLFNDKEQPLAERLSFFHADKVNVPMLQIDTLSFGRRSHNAWKINIDTSTFHTYTTLIADGSNNPAKDNFLSSLLLTNDIKYKPANAAWYFTSNSALRQQALDALLISENWRWFTWQNILSDIYPKKDIPKDWYLSFTGTVFNGKKLQMNKDINLLFQLKDSAIIFQQVNTDSSGSFELNGALFEDTIKVFYKVNSKKASSKNIEVLFEQNNTFKRLMAPLPSSPYILTTRTTNDSLPIALQRMLAAYKTQSTIDNKYKSLQEVIVKSRRGSATARLNDSLSTLFFNTGNETIYDFVNQEQHAYGYNNIMDWIRARVPGTVSWGNQFVYIDEISSPVEEAYRLPISNVALVKVFQGSSRFDGGGSYNFGRGYTIAIYTRRGFDGRDRGLPQGYLVGYKKIDTYMPFDYAADGYEQIQSDEREVLYWNTSLWPDKKQATVKFYNSDVTKSYRVVVMGFTKEGQPVYLEKVVAPE